MSTTSTAGLALLLHDRDGDAAAVVDDGDGVVGVDRDRHLGAEAGEGLVDGVVDDLIDEVVQAHHAGRADVHAGALADGLQALEDGDVLGVVAGRAASWRVVQSPASPVLSAELSLRDANGPPMT